MAGREATAMHTGLLRISLIPEESQIFWCQHDPDRIDTEAQHAYDEYWFGSVNKNTVRALLNTLRNRFANFSHCLYPLKKWTDMLLQERNLICHWHLQLSDPLYRQFTADYLSDRFLFPPASIHRENVVLWINQVEGERWRRSTQIQFASKLISCAKAAGFVKGNKDPRQLQYPSVSHRSLSYLLYLLREIKFEGSLLDNPYLKAVGLKGALLENQLRQCTDLSVQKMGDLVEFNWMYNNLKEWADARWSQQGVHHG